MRANMLDLASRLPRTTGVFESAKEIGSEPSLARLSHGADDGEAGCGGIFNSGTSPPLSGGGERGIINHRHEFRGPFPHTPRPQSGAAADGATLDSTLRMLEPQVQGWLCGIRAGIAAETAKKIYVIGYAQDNPTLGFAVARMAAEFLIKNGLDPRLISVSRDDQARTGPDVWVRVMEIPTRAGAEARRVSGSAADASPGRRYA